MNTANLALQQTPPISVPFRFFLTAPLFGVLASVLLVWRGVELFSSRWNVDLLALTHLVVLGVICMVMMGAVLQLIPILMGVPIPHSRWVSTVLHLFLTLGTLALACGFLEMLPPPLHCVAHPLKEVSAAQLESVWLFKSAILLLGLSFVMFLGVAGYCLIQVTVHNPISWAMQLAFMSLAVTVTIGLMLGATFSNTWMVSWSPVMLTQWHLTWGLVGWVSVLVMGVAYQVVPMFQITPQYPLKVRTWLVPILFLSLIGWAIFYGLANLNQWSFSWSQLVEGVLGIGLSVFAITTLFLQSRRLRKLPDLTLNYWRVGMVCLLMAVGWRFTGILWPAVTTQPVYEIILGILFIAGFVLSVIQGMLYKIIPFLVWLHLQNRQLDVLKAVRLVKLPNMKQVFSERWARRQFWLYLFGLALLLATPIGLPGIVQIAGVVWFCSFLLLGYNLYSALWLYLSVSRQMVAST